MQVVVGITALRLEGEYHLALFITLDEHERHGHIALGIKCGYFTLWTCVDYTIGGNVHYLNRVLANVGHLPQVATVCFIQIVPLQLLGVQGGIHSLDGMGLYGLCDILVGFGVLTDDVGDAVGPYLSAHDAIVAIGDYQRHQF